MILMLLVLSLSVAALEPVYIGSGSGGKVINLDAGVKQPHQSFSFGRSGFVTPKMPQPMALSPDMMINQAKDIKDEVLAIRDEAVAARDEAKAKQDAIQILMSQMEVKERSINELQASAQSSAEASSASASMAEELYAKTNEAYGRTLGLSVKAAENLNQTKALVDKAGFHANESALSAAKAGGYLKDIVAINGRIFADQDGSASVTDESLASS